MPLLAALAMSVGWGFRGDYGHEAGAMVPGALLALAICLGAGRADWWARASLLAFLGAVGWAFGGQMSYGIVIGYTAHSSFPDVLYGYASLFVIGALWGGIGAGILALGVTETRAELERFAGPLITLYLVWAIMDFSGVTEGLSNRWSLFDTDWVAAASALLTAGIYAGLRPVARRACALIALLAAGWWLGLLLLTIIAGLRMTPPRSDNWAGCVGLWLTLAIWLYSTNRRAALLMSGYGLLAGGIGFALADFVNMVGRAQWGWIGQSETLRALNSWKWMEQLFGLIMGLGVALGFRRLARNLPPPLEIENGGSLSYVTLLFLLLVMQWENLSRNVRTWSQHEMLAEGLFGIAPQWWFLLTGALLSLIIALAIRQHRRNALPLVPANAFGRAQLLFLLLLWLAVVAALTQAFPELKTRGVLFVHLTFWLTACLCSLLVLLLRHDTQVELSEIMSADDRGWRPGWRYLSVWVMMPLLLLLLARMSTAMHSEPLPGSHSRFAAVSDN